ncbi:GumC family protein [Mesorhizobium sp. WSM3626]|uniref:GumC family protein n=1 Tax=Mesorhizobium sp. WSM3626 TaxID=1040987 RepID=UPI000482A3E4|nr:GumC family protein [Mesorhizobium sp. WSM3626]
MATSMGGISRDRSAARRAQVDTSVDLLGLADTLIRRRWIVLSFTLTFVALGLLALFLISPRYTATSRILIDPREQRVMQNEVVQQGFGSDMALVESQIEVITSEAVLKRVVQSSGLATDPEFISAIKSGQDPSVIALEALAQATKVVRPENTYVLQISVTSKEAIKSARLANAVAAAYLGYQAETTSGTARDASTSIRDRLAQLQSELNSSEEEVEAFKRDHNVSESDGRLLGDRELTDLSARQSASAARVNETKARFEVMQAALKTRGDVSTVITGTDSAMVDLRTQLGEAQRNLAELQQILGPRHPRVTAAEGQVMQARATIRAESERLVQAAQDDYRAAVDTLNKVTGDLNAAKTASFDTNQDLIKLRELERKAQSSKVVYEAFMVRAKETAEQENISPPNARIIAEAAVPSSSSYPPKLPLLIAAGLLGLFIGVFAAILRDLAAGALAARPQAQPLEPAKADITGGLVTVVSIHDPALARQAAFELARDAMAADQKVIFIDLASDAPSDIAGLAELAIGESPVAKAIRIGRKSGLQMLNAGRKDTVARLSPGKVEAVLGAIIQEYDHIVVNGGTLEASPGPMADVIAGYSSRSVLAVRDGVFGLRERQALNALAGDGDMDVSVVSVEKDVAIDQAA